MINEITTVHDKRLENLLVEFNKFLPLLKIKKFKFAKTLNKSQPFRMKDNDKLYFSSYRYCFSASLDENESVDDSFNNDSPKFDLTAVYDELTDKVEVNRVNFDFTNLDDPVLFYLIDTNNLEMLKPLISEVSQFILKNSLIIEYLTVQVGFNIDGTFDNLNLVFHYNSFNYSSNSYEYYYTNNISLYNRSLIKYYELNTPNKLKDFAKMTFLSISNPNMMELFSCSDWQELWDMYSTNPDSVKAVLEMSS